MQVSAILPTSLSPGTTVIAKPVLTVCRRRGHDHANARIRSDTSKLLDQGVVITQHSVDPRIDRFIGRREDVIWDEMYRDYIRPMAIIELSAIARKIQLELPGRGFINEWASGFWSLVVARSRERAMKGNKRLSRPAAVSFVP